MQVLSKINLVLNWKKTNKNYAFFVNEKYSLADDIGNYLLESYGNKFEKIVPMIFNNDCKFNIPIRKKPKTHKNVIWTIGMVNYKSIEFIKHQLKTLYEFNSVSFKLIIVDNSIPSEFKELKELCKDYSNIKLIKNIPEEHGTSCQHSEGLELLFKHVDTEYLLIQDPDFFWVQRDYLKKIQYKLDEGYVCVGAPFYREGYSEDCTPALWGCAYDTSILEPGDFYSFQGKENNDILSDLQQGKDTGWRLRTKFEEQKLPTYSFCDKLGISVDNDFNKIDNHFISTNINGIHEYRYNDEIIAYHLSHGCHDTEKSFPTLEDRKSANHKWSNIRKKYSDFFYQQIEKSENKKMRIDVHFLTKNDEKILPYFFRHYDKYEPRYFAYFNNLSTDKTLEMLLSKPKMTIIEDSNPKMDDNYFRHMKNNMWREYSNSSDCDWVIVCDSDEFLYHNDLISLLEKYDYQGINFPNVQGYQMYNDTFIFDDGVSQIYDLIKKGCPANNYDKFAIMKPYISPEYSYGCHFASPQSSDTPVKYSDESEIKLLHYTIFGDHFIAKMMNRQNDLSDFNRAMGMGVYTLDPNDKFNPQIEYERVKNNCKDVI